MGGVAAAMALFVISAFSSQQVLGDNSDLFSTSFYTMTILQLFFTVSTCIFDEMDAERRANTRTITLGLTKQQENKVGLLV